MKSSPLPRLLRSTYSLAFALFFPLIGLAASVQAIVEDAVFNKTVTVVFSGSTATVTDADGTGVTIASSGSSAVAITSTASGVQYVLSGATTDGYLELTSANSAKVVLAGVNLASSDGPALSVHTSKPTYLVLADGKANTLAAPASYSRAGKGTVHAGDKLLISGTGSLQISSLSGLGIYAESDIRVLAGSLTVLAPTKDSVHSKTAVLLEGGNLTQTATNADIAIARLAGNEDRATAALDTAAMIVPTVTSPPTTDDTTPTLTGTAGASNTVKITVDGTAAGTATASTTGYWSFTLPTLTAGTHAIVVTATDADGNSSTANFSQTIIATNFSAPKPYGYAASVTGGTGGTNVVVSTAEEFTKYATSGSAYIITVMGDLDIGTVAVGPYKTIQGFDADSTLEGCLSLSAVGNVIIRGLNLVNPDGHALQIANSQLVFVTHCTFLDCAGAQVNITYSDLLTFSWCVFAAQIAPGQPAMKLGREGGTDTPRITLHNNWWSTGLGSALPAAETGYVHQFSDYIAAAGNTSATALTGNAQLLSEKNLYSGVSNSLTKAGTATIRVIDNVYTNCTGTTAAGTDAVFTPGYSYEMLAPADVATTVETLAGNTAGAAYIDPASGTATITATATTVASGASTTLTAVPKDVTASTYQWRLANVAIAGATSSTYTISSMSSSTAGKYTVAIGLADGSTVVSVPITLTLGTATPDDDDDDNGGGGACGLLLPALLALFALRGRRA